MTFFTSVTCTPARSATWHAAVGRVTTRRHRRAQLETARQTQPHRGVCAGKQLTSRPARPPTRHTHLCEGAVVVEAREGGDVFSGDGRRMLLEHQRVGVGGVGHHQDLSGAVGRRWVAVTQHWEGCGEGGHEVMHWRRHAR